MEMLLLQILITEMKNSIEMLNSNSKLQKEELVNLKTDRLWILKIRKK